MSDNYFLGVERLREFFFYDLHCTFALSEAKLKQNLNSIADEDIIVFEKTTHLHFRLIVLITNQTKSRYR